MDVKIPTLVKPGATAWKVVRADRATLLVDAASYVGAMTCAIRNARRSILLLGWDFDPLVPLTPGYDNGAQSERFCDLLDSVIDERPNLSVHILVWDMTWVFSIQRRHKPQHAKRWLPKHQVHYRLDGKHPLGASHHQKVLVIDDSIAFCGGADFTRNRWDTPEHRAKDARRQTVDGSLYGPRHEVVIAVDGEAAAALGELARQRWFVATGERLQPTPDGPTVWPDLLKPDVTDVTIKIARTEPAVGGGQAIREVESLYLSAIGAAKHWIYLENQYFTSPVIGEALARRLTDHNGPEVILVCPSQSGGRFDRLAMDHARNHLIHWLRAVDKNGRFRAFAAMADGETAISVHSKVMVVDDRVLRIGSANLNNRSLGLDTECDLAIEVEPENKKAGAAIRNCLVRLLAEHTGVSVNRFAGLLQRTGGLGAAIDAASIRSGRHLESFPERHPNKLDRLFGTMHLLDPFGTADNWRPWRRLGLGRDI